MRFRHKDVSIDLKGCSGVESCKQNGSQNLKQKCLPLSTSQVQVVQGSGFHDSPSPYSSPLYTHFSASNCVMSVYLTFKLRVKSSKLE